MKILMVNKFLHPNGGSETYIFNLGKQLEEFGHEVQFFGMNHPKRCMGNRREIYTDNMDFHAGKLEKILYPFKILYSKEAYHKMVAILEDFQPDIVHLNNINFQLTPSVIDAVRSYDEKRKGRTGIIATAHDYQWVCPNHMLMIPSNGQLCFACEGGKFGNCSKNRCIHGSKIKSILGALEGYIYRWRGTYKQVDQIICPSQFLNEKLQTNPVFKDKTITMHNFIVPSKEADEGDRVTTKAGKELPEEYVVYFGRYAEEKGILVLLEVCKALSHIPFVFAGTGPLEQQVNQVDNITNLGFLSGNTLKTVIEQAAFCVFPSQWYENCPFSVMETQLWGTPILASSLGGTPELVQDKVTGELFRGGDEEELKRKLEVLWQNPQRVAEYRKNCGKVQFSTLQEYTERLLEIYQTVDAC